MSKKTSVIVTTIVVIALAFFGYEYFSKPEALAPVDTVSTDGETTEIEIPGAEVIALYDRVNALSLDVNVFTNPVLLHLTDLNITLPALTVGRSNPFAALGVEGSAQTSRSAR